MNIFNIGPMELLLILVVVLIVFGPNKLPEVGASIGGALRKFRQASKQLTEELDLEDLNPSSIVDALAAQAEAQEATPTPEKQPQAASLAEPSVSPTRPETAPTATVAAPAGAVAAAASAIPTEEPSASKSRFVISPSSLATAAAKLPDSQPSAADAVVAAPPPAEPVPGVAAVASVQPTPEASGSKSHFLVPQSSLSAAAVAEGPAGQPADEASGAAPTAARPAPDPLTPTADYASPEDGT